MSDSGRVERVRKEVVCKGISNSLLLQPEKGKVHLNTPKANHKFPNTLVLETVLKLQENDRIVIVSTYSLPGI